jgi:hypothetical protein
MCPPTATAATVLSSRVAMAQEGGGVCEETQTEVFWNTLVGTPEKPCESRLQNRTNFVRFSDDSDASLKTTGNWSGDFKYKWCEQHEVYTRYLKPVSVSAECKHEKRIKSFNSNISCYLPAAPAPGQCTSKQTNLWTTLSGSYTFEKCRELESRKYWKAPSAPKQSQCVSETQVRSRENFGAWSKWGGKNLFPACIGRAQPLALKYEQRQRYQEAEVTWPSHTCVVETQVRVEEIDKTTGEVLSGQFGRWTGKNSFLSCVERDVIVDAPELTKPPSRIIKYGKKQCNITTVRERRHDHITGVGQWDWNWEKSASSLVGTTGNCLTKHGFDEACDRFIPVTNKKRYAEGTIVNGKCTKESGCNEGWDGTRMGGTCTSVDVAGICIMKGSQFFVENSSSHVPYDGTEGAGYTSSYGVATAKSQQVVDPKREKGSYRYRYPTCEEIERKVMYAEPAVTSLDLCKNETQTRKRVYDETGQRGSFTPWSGTYQYSSCVDSPVEVENRTLWQDAKLSYVYSNTSIPPTKLPSYAPCISELQTRTRFKGNNTKWQAWSGSYTNPACIETWTLKISNPSLCPTLEVRTRTNNLPANMLAVNGSISMKACNNLKGKCQTPTPKAVRFESGSATGAACKFEVGEMCTLTGSSVHKGPYYLGNYSLNKCIETQVRIRWQSLWSEDSPCLSESQSRSREVKAVVDASQPQLGEWAKWSGTYTYSSCMETRFKIISKETFAISKLKDCNDKPLGKDVCAANMVIERRVNNGNWYASKTPFKDVCDRSKASPFGANPVNCTKALWYEKAAVAGSCAAHAQLRETCMTSQFGLLPLSGNPKYRYDKCTEADLQKRFQFADNTKAKRKCNDYKEIQQRSREVDGTWPKAVAQPWSKWTGDFQFKNCSANLVAQTRIRWQAAQSACTDTGDRLPCGDYMCRKSMDCVPEIQTRNRDSASGVWGDWSGTYVYKDCVQTETILRWKSSRVKNSLCQKEIRSRTRKNNGGWSDWDGGFTQLACTEVRTRIRWDRQTAATDQCREETQERRRINNGAWPSRWTGGKGFTEPNCTETEQTKKWRDRYTFCDMDTSPNQCRTSACVSQQLVRARTKVLSSSATWSDWKASGGANAFLFAECKQVEYRRRYENTLEQDNCHIQEQLREKQCKNNCGHWGGKPWDKAKTKLEDYGWVSKANTNQMIYLERDCTQRTGVQTETRQRYKQDKGSIAQPCQKELQTRSRAGGGAWSPWNGGSNGGVSTQVWDAPMCMEYESRAKWLHSMHTHRRNTPCTTISPECSKCRKVVENRVRAPGTAWDKWDSEKEKLTLYDSCIDKIAIQLYENTEVVMLSSTGSTGKNCTGSPATEQRLLATQQTINQANTFSQPYPLPTATGPYLKCIEKETLTKFACPVAECTSLENCNICQAEARARSRPAGTTVWSDWDGSYEYAQCIEVQIRKRVEYAASCLTETQTRSRKCKWDWTLKRCLGTWTAWSGTYKFDDPACEQGPTEKDLSRGRYQAWKSAGKGVLDGDSAVSALVRGVKFSEYGRTGGPQRETRIMWQDAVVFADTADDAAVGETCKPVSLDKCSKPVPLDSNSCLRCSSGTTYQCEACCPGLTLVKKGQRSFCARLLPGCAFEIQHRTGKGSKWTPWSGSYSHHACAEMEIQHSYKAPYVPLPTSPTDKYHKWTETSKCGVSRRRYRELGPTDINLETMTITKQWDGNSWEYYADQKDSNCKMALQVMKCTAPVDKHGKPAAVYKERFAVIGKTAKGIVDEYQAYIKDVKAGTTPIPLNPRPTSQFAGFNPAVPPADCAKHTQGPQVCTNADGIEIRRGAASAPQYWSKTCTQIDTRVRYKKSVSYLTNAANIRHELTAYTPCTYCGSQSRQEWVDGHKSTRSCNCPCQAEMSEKRDFYAPSMNQKWIPKGAETNWKNDAFNYTLSYAYRDKTQEFGFSHCEEYERAVVYASATVMSGSAACNTTEIKHALYPGRVRRDCAFPTCRAGQEKEYLPQWKDDRDPTLPSPVLQNYTDWGKFHRQCKTIETRVRYRKPKGSELSPCTAERQSCYLASDDKAGCKPTSWDGMFSSIGCTECRVRWNNGITAANNCSFQKQYKSFVDVLNTASVPFNGTYNYDSCAEHDQVRFWEKKAGQVCPWKIQPGIRTNLGEYKHALP